MWRLLRVTILLLILAMVLGDALYRDGKPAWKRNLYVTLYPINADGSVRSSQYLQSLRAEDFSEIASYFAEESARYNFHVRRPFEVRLGNAITDQPPQMNAANHVLDIMLWSLKFRWWAYQHRDQAAIKPDIRLYLLLFDPASHAVLPHSTALSKGRIGLVHIFAHRQYAAQNQVIIAHELLHTVGATDKYAGNAHLPVFPDGYAEPDKQPLYPQAFAELMGGRRPISDQLAEIPLGLAHTLVGKRTAQEIGWQQ